MIITCGNYECGKQTYSLEDKPFIYCPFCGVMYVTFNVYPGQLAFQERHRQKIIRKRRSMSTKLQMWPCAAILGVILTFLVKAVYFRYQLKPVDGYLIFWLMTAWLVWMPVSIWVSRKKYPL